jgi:hypothetical protein
MIRQLDAQCRKRTESVADVMVEAEAPAASCPRCGCHMRVRKTWKRSGVTLAHGRFTLRQKVHVCPAGCPQPSQPGSLSLLIPPHSAMGYDVMVHVGLQRFLDHCQREEIRAELAGEHGLQLSSGEVSVLAARFLTYLERLHQASAPGLRAALAADGGWPLHVDATGEDGRGTLLVVFDGWRQWVLGSWKVPTERAEVILPRLREIAFRFGAPCAIMRDLGRAMAEASQSFLREQQLSIPVLACHLHFLRDIGKDLLEDLHHRLRGLFRQTGLRRQLRILARDLGRGLGTQVEEGRAGLRQWQANTAGRQRIPSGIAGIAVVRGLTQWTLDYPADGAPEGFPFDLPWLRLYDRCLQTVSAVKAFLESPPEDRKVRNALERLGRILQPVESNTPAFGELVADLSARAALFAELRQALRLTEGSKPPKANISRKDLLDIRAAVERLNRSLRRRRVSMDLSKAIDIVLSHLTTHRQFLWGHVIRLPKKSGGGFRLVDRTNNVLESYFHRLKHGERRRSGRKILTQDFEHLSPAAALAANLSHEDYVKIVCGSLDRLPEAFARLDSRRLRQPVPTTTLPRDPETASLSTADRRLIRTQGMADCVMAAAQNVHRKGAAA